MKVNGPTESIRLDGTANATPGVGERAAPASRTDAAPVDSVSLSDLSTYLARLGADLTADAPFDASRVEAIKAAIRNGEFKVNPEAVADQLIQSVRELLAGKA